MMASVSSAHGMAHTFRRDMAISHADFLRLLPTAIRRAGCDLPLPPSQARDTTIRIGHGAQRIEIELGTEHTCTLSSLTLPRSVIVFHFSGYDMQKAKAIMGHFDATYRRGGG